MQIQFDTTAEQNKDILQAVQGFLQAVPTLEGSSGSVIIHQDGRSWSYYIRCSIMADLASIMADFDARLVPESPDSFRANRELLLRHHTYLRMKSDAEKGREFSDIIVEFNPSYDSEKPLKVWGGQHRSLAIQEAVTKGSPPRYHGYRVYFSLSTAQRTDLALTSNTSIVASNDLFDRQLEETLVGPNLRKWCSKVGLLGIKEDFPDVAARSEKITVQMARTFIVNFHKGVEKGQFLTPAQVDRDIYEPYICRSGATLDPAYQQLIEGNPRVWDDPGLRIAGITFAALHKEQSTALKKADSSRKSWRTKALTPSVLSSWSYTAGLLQKHQDRLQNHFTVPQPPEGAVDPLNAKEMSEFRRDEDPPTA